MKDSVKITWIIVSAVFAIALIGGLIYWNVNAPKNELNVDGQSSVKAMPDLVSVYFTIETNGATAKVAKDNNSLISSKVTDNLIKIGLERKEIVTESFNIYEDFDWSSGRQVSKGFKATNSLKVQLNSSEIDKVGGVIDAGVDGGAMISYINFELSTARENYYKAIAFKNAAEDARIKAGAIAEGLGKEVGKLVSVSTSNFDYYPWPIYSNAGGVARDEIAMAKQVTTNIQPGERDVSAQVSAVFKIV